MKLRTYATLLLAVLVLAGCRRHEATVTGSYGNAVLSGQVVMTNGSSPAGVEMTAGGMIATLGEDGGFVFGGVPETVVVSFRRAADGIDTRMNVRPAAGLVIELDGRGGRRRGALPSKREFEGLIREISEDSIVVFSSHKEEVTIAIDGLTIIRKGNTTLTTADLEPNDRVHVRTTTKEGVLTAVEIKLQNEDDDDDGDDEGQTMTANGPVLSVSGDNLVVFSQPRGEVTVQTDASTVIRRQGVQISVSDIVAGVDEVNSMGTRVDDHTLLARQIEVRGNSKPKR
ncbi:MAG TPA: DUF5666 domain-containing protein [Thermoanaerobaculia bacterium]|nr:DUF5666 domain-containing protein [Thermoanaerobaculia bacterium]